MICADQTIEGVFRRRDPDGARVARVVAGAEAFSECPAEEWPTASSLMRRSAQAMLEIGLQREFSFEDGANTSFAIAGRDVEVVVAGIPGYAPWRLVTR